MTRYCWKPPYTVILTQKGVSGIVARLGEMSLLRFISLTVIQCIGKQADNVIMKEGPNHVGMIFAQCLTGQQFWGLDLGPHTFLGHFLPPHIIFITFQKGQILCLLGSVVLFE